MAENTPVSVYRTERVLTYMAASSIGLAILGIIAVIIVNLTGINTEAPIWVTIAVIPPIGLTLGVVFAIAFIVVSAIRRTRESKDAVN